jgi:class 3 adenylate cyclase
MAGQGRRGLRAAAPRDLRTVLFTDIVGSTEVAARLGDRAYGALLARHHAVIRDALRTSGGREVDTAGDGFFATFGRPTAALACARAIVTGVHDLGLAVRVGVHAGEVETLDGKAGGISVHLAARLMAAAGADEVLLSATVHDLVAGAGWTFLDRGVLTLKGLAEPVHAYALDLSAPAPSLARGLGPWASLAERAGGPWVLGAGALVVLLAAGGILLANRSPGGAAHSPSVPPSGSVAAAALHSVSAAAASALATQPAAGVSAAASGGWSMLPDAANVGDIPLAPGTYRDLSMQGAPTFTLGPGWTAVSSPLDTNLWLQRRTAPEDTWQLFTPTQLSSDPCGQTLQPITGEPEAAFTRWLQREPALKVLGPLEARQFGPLGVTQVDLSVIASRACSYTTPPSVLLVSAPPSGVFLVNNVTIDAGSTVRLWYGSYKGRLLLFVLQAPTADDFATVEPLAEGILQTLVLGS